MRAAQYLSFFTRTNAALILSLPCGGTEVNSSEAFYVSTKRVMYIRSHSRLALMKFNELPDEESVLRFLTCPRLLRSREIGRFLLLRTGARRNELPLTHLLPGPLQRILGSS